MCRVFKWSTYWQMVDAMELNTSRKWTLSYEKLNQIREESHLNENGRGITRLETDWRETDTGPARKHHCQSNPCIMRHWRVPRERCWCRAVTAVISQGGNVRDEIPRRSLWNPQCPLVNMTCNTSHDSICLPVSTVLEYAELSALELQTAQDSSTRPPSE